MSRLKITLMEYGTNKKIKDVFMEGHIPAEGEFFIDDVRAGDGWKEKMYIVRAVTHFHDNLVAIHVEKYDTDAQELKWREAVKHWEEMKERWKIDGSEKSEEDK